MASGKPIRHFLPNGDEVVLNNRLASGLPTLLVTVLDVRRSWMVGLDQDEITDPSLNTLQNFTGLDEWVAKMAAHVRDKQTFSLIDGAVIFLRNAKQWLAPQQLNDALFYIEGDGGGKATFRTEPAQNNRSLREG